MMLHVQHSSPGWSTLPYEVLLRHQNQVFMETGTFMGGGVALALQFPFKVIHSIEIEPTSHFQAAQMFSHEDRVKLHLGDSGVIIADILPTITTPATFWLDGHAPHTPLYQELLAIARHQIKTHTIIIDDLRVFGKSMWGIEVDLKTTMDLLLAINPDYRFKRVDSCNGPQDILVAYP